MPASGAAGASRANAVYRIEKMDCPTEEALLRKSLEGLPGVQRLDFNLMERTLKVEHSLSDPISITDAIAALGMAPVLQPLAGPAVPRSTATAPAISRKQFTRPSCSPSRCWSRWSLRSHSGSRGTTGSTKPWCCW